LAQRSIIVAVVLLLAVPARAQDRDPWIGVDKAGHFALAALLAGGGFVLGSLLLDSLAGRLGTGAGLAIGAGIGKELWDDQFGGDPSSRDLAWDALGTAVGLVAGWCIVAALDPRRAGDRAAADDVQRAEPAADSLGDLLLPTR
jgi:uncharacterized protein YfiM (DUF2279 family)